MQDNGLYRTDSMGIESALSTNKVLKNTYMLLGMTLLFSAVTAGISMAMGLGHGMALIFMLVGFGLLFVVNRLADSSKGLLAIFAFAGVMAPLSAPCLTTTSQCRAVTRWSCKRWAVPPSYFLACQLTR